MSDGFEVPDPVDAIQKVTSGGSQSDPYRFWWVCAILGVDMDSMNRLFPQDKPTEPEA